MYKNVPDINKIPLYGSSKQTIEDVFRTQKTIAYDEMMGMKLAFEERGLKQYVNRHLFADIIPYTNMLCNDIYNLPGQFYEWHNGRVYWCIKIFDRIIRLREVSYVHLQKRKMGVDEVLGEYIYLYNDHVSGIPPKDKMGLTTLREIICFYVKKVFKKLGD